MKRGVLAAGVVLTGLFSGAGTALDGGIEEGFAHSVELTEARDMSADGKLSRKGGMPILLLVSQLTCPYCEQIKREILHPMVVAGDYKGELLIRELYMDTRGRIRDFRGRYVDNSQFAYGYGVHLTPTLLFLGPDGRELTKRMVGINTPEFYFYYVDQAIQSAIAALK
jgi:thioredoxin-related protein